MRVLLVEDDRQIGSVIRRGLESARFEVEWATDGEAGLDRALAGWFEVIILDLMLPGMDGWTVCRVVREARRTTPILMLSARDTVEARIRGFEIGADDYLSKPFNFGELLARVRALTRRDQVHKTRVIRIADLETDTIRARVSRSGRVISLTGEEYALLEALAGQEGRVLSREALRQRVAFEAVEAHLDSLRHKIDDARVSRLIQARDGGYTLRGPELVTAA